MASELDRRLLQANATLTGEGGPFPLGATMRDGVEIPYILTAPPTLIEYFAHFCAQHGDKTFLVDGEERLSFAQAHALAVRVAKGLLERHGVARGDRIGIAMRNASAWVIAYMAVTMAGGIATLLNGWWQTRELDEAIADTTTSLVLADGPRADRLAEGAGIAPVIRCDLTGGTQAAFESLLGADEVVLPIIDAHDYATILFTSGSTGASKGAFSTHRSVVQGAFNYLVQTSSMLIIATEDGRAPTLQPATIVNTPLFHVTAEVPTFLQSFGMGRKLVMMPKWDAEAAMRLIEDEQITYFVGVPLMSFEMLTHERRGEYDLSSCALFAAGGAPRPSEHVKRLAEGMGGGQPALGYGLTETNAVGTGNISTNYLAKPDSAGMASRPLVELGIFDDAGERLRDDQTGEIGIRSIANFEGYWGNEAATRAAFTADRFFLTGDLGYIDADGYLYIVDRKKDIIIRGGENISGLEVEAVIYEHPDVAECSVFGLPDAKFGEVPAAVVHFRDGVGDEAMLRDFLRPRLAAYKMPERIWISAEPLPRGDTEKIDKKALREAYRRALEA